MALVEGRLTSANPNLHLHEAVFPVQPEGDQSLALNRAGRKELSNLALVQQELPATFWFMLRMAGAFVWLDVSIVQKYFTVFNPCESVAQVSQAVSDRLACGAPEFYSCLYPVDNLVIVERSAIRSDLRGHGDRERWSQSLGCVVGFRQELEGELTVDNFLQSDIGVRHTRSHFYERAMPGGQLSHSF